MPLELTFLGTSSMAPTRERNVQSMVLSCDGRLIVLDCGEGTLRQMAMAKLSPARVGALLITHWHWDHVGGLVGLVQEIAVSGGERRLQIYGPTGTRSKLDQLRNVIEGGRPWPVDVRELDPQPGEAAQFLTTDEYELNCAAMSHGCPTLGYAIAERDKFHVDRERALRLGLSNGPLIGELIRTGQVQLSGRTVSRDECCTREPGARVSIIPDTTPTKAIAALCSGVNLMVCESTYTSENADLATKNHHMTATDAARAARDSGAKRLVLTHFSQRYRDVEALVNEAHSVFLDVTAATDLMTIRLSD